MKDEIRIEQGAENQWFILVIENCQCYRFIGWSQLHGKPILVRSICCPYAIVCKFASYDMAWRTAQEYVFGWIPEYAQFQIPVLGE